MKTENVVLMDKAKESLQGKWGVAIATIFLYLLISMILQVIPVFGPIVSFLISGPFSLGIAIFSLSVSRNEDAKLEQLFKGFNNFGVALGAYVLIILFVFLWMLLLIIPGIIAGISYSLTFYILADDDSIGAMQAIDKSKKMMDGYKWKLVGLGFRFFGWALLCILTLGIGFLWLIPYVQITLAKFYEDVKENYTNSSL